MKRQAETQDQHSKRPRVDQLLEQKQHEIAEKLIAKERLISDNMTETERKIQEAKLKRMEKEAQEKAKMLLKSALDKVHDEEVKSKGGLNVQLHPALMNMNEKYTKGYKPLLPKFSSIKANQKLVKEEVQEVRVRPERKDIENPYLQPVEKGMGIKPKRQREFKFNEPGKYIALGNEIRTKEMVEKLKEEIEEKARVVGLERELELVSNLAIRTEPPPEIEWWDANLFPNQTYASIDINDSKWDTIITNLVQHPVPIDPPNEGPPPEPRPLMLTEKERKKLRRQNRLEQQREKQDKIRLGLLPPDQPRVTKTNFMRVMGQEAILAPSMVEAVMAKQVQDRQEKHVAANEASKLTEEERKLKKDSKLREDTSLLTHVAVFKYCTLTRIKSLEHKQHLFKINTNAQQYKLTGAAVMNPNINLVIVEGGPKGIRHYTKLMMNRIKWEEHIVNEEPNECILIWEGTIPKSNFKFFKMKKCETTREVKEYLERMNSMNYWNAARNYLTEEY